MKHILAALLFVFAVGSVAAQSAPTTLTLAWTNNDSSYGPACTSPVTTKPCLQTTTASDITSLTPVILSGTINPSATSFTYTFPTAPSYGNHSYVVVANGLDANGVAASSAPSNTATVDIEPKLNAPQITSAKVN